MLAQERVDRSTVSRSGSPDSAISSNSSKLSVLSSGSIISRLSTREVTKRLGKNLDPISETKVVRANGDISQDTINWVNNLTPERARAAVPLIRTQAVSNGNLTRLTANNINDNGSTGNCYNTQMVSEKVPQSGVVPEAVIYLYIFTSWAVMLSNEQHVKVRCTFRNSRCCHLYFSKQT